MSDAIYTVGHSTHSIERLIALLKAQAITAVSDVRSNPYSRLNPQFNRERLKSALREEGIKYAFLGKELGARSEDRSCYVNGQARYELLAETELFKQGVSRVIEGSRSYRVALLCAEKEPLECHRTILVARKLVERGISVKHILSDSTVEDHAHAMERLISKLRIPNDDMFRMKEVVISEAYSRQGDQIAYREQDASAQSDDELALRRAVGGAE